MNKKNLTRVAGLSAATMLALKRMAEKTTESALVKGGALNLRETASLDAKVLGSTPPGRWWKSSRRAANGIVSA